MSLFLIRHAKSSWSDGQLADFDRPLNKRGSIDLLIMKQQILQKGWSFDLVVSSSSNRTQLTCEGLDLNGVYRDDLYHASAEKIMSVINEYSEFSNLVIICHNPGITEFVNKYCHAAIDNIPTLGICKVSDNLKLQEFIYPKMFKEL